MNLELKHLAPYLPYGLKIKNPKGNQPLILSIYERNGFSINDVITNNSTYKPLLYKLSNLENQSFLTDYIVSKRGEWFDNKQSAESWVKITIQEIEDAPYILIEKLFQNHFDIFGLIDAGLAIDINTI